MANSDKNIVIRPSIGSTIDQPSITFTGAGNTSITLKILDDSDGTLSFEGYQGQVFAINNNLASGIIYSVNDISGLPVIDANADGTIRLGIYTGNIGIGVTNPFQKFQIGAANTLGISTDGQIFVVTSNEDVGIGTTRPIVKLHVVGNTLVTGIVTATGGFNIGIQSAGVNITTGVVTALNFVGSGNTFNYNSSTRTIDISIAGGSGGSGNISISTNTTNQTQYLTYAVSTGSTSGLGVNLSSLVFNPSTTRLGIGTTNPLGILQVGAGTSTFIINQVGTAVSVGIGTTNPQYIFTVTDTGTPATTGLTNCLADFTTTANSYGQINLRNTSTGTNASADIIVTANNGTDSTNFIDLGINNSGFSVGSWTINGANDGYLYTSDGNLSIGAINASVAKYISFFTGGTLISNERARINSTGVGIGTTNPLQPVQVGVAGSNVVVIDNTGELGIGTTNPTSKLHVVGDVRITGVLTTGDLRVVTGSGTTIFSASGVGSTSTSAIFSVTDFTDTSIIDVTTTGDVILTPSYGEVGIGTTNPAYKLDVLGTSRLNGGAVIGTASTTSFYRMEFNPTSQTLEFTFVS